MTVRIIVCILILSIINEVSTKPPSVHRPNVLFLLADDLRPQIRAFGPPFPSAPMITPNLDKLASQSLVLKRAYCQVAVCSPSRSSFMTSRRPDTTRVYDNVLYFREVGGNFTTIPQYFKENGYHSLGIGKVYHPRYDIGRDDPPSWSEAFYHPPNEDHYPNGTERAIRVVNHTELEAEPLEDMYTTNHAIKRLAELAPKAKSGEQPFFMAVGFIRPHLPFVFPEEFLYMYPLENISIANNPYAPQNMPWLAWNNWYEMLLFQDIRDLGVSGDINETMPIHAAKALRRAYYASVSYVDSLVGALLKELDKQGLSSNTIVTFAGDHGWHLGEDGEWGKRTNFELGTLVPLMMRVPGLTDHGLVTDALVELVDLYPSLVEAADLPPIPLCPTDSANIKLCTEGTSFLPLMQKSPPKWKTGSFSQYTRLLITVMGYTVRTDRYRYTEWVRFHDLPIAKPDWSVVHARELYDYVKDPNGTRNVVDNAEYAKIRKKLSKKLRDGWKKAIPTGDEYMEIYEQSTEATETTGL